MGVKELWKLFREEKLMQEWSCETHGAGVQKAVADQIEGKVVAVDISQWACNALTQQATADLWSEEGRVVKVAFDRIVNFLRFGCTPVGVLDGEAPEAKLATLQARFLVRFGIEGGGYGNQIFISQCQAVARLFRALGLWVVQAPGEAEATCAALNRGGYVDACATIDSDVLLFGAETAFHTLKPLTATPNQCVLSSLDMARVRAYLGISADGHLALIAMALLLGGDYHMRGAERIGPKQALLVVRYLLEGHNDDKHVIQALCDFLQTAEEEHADVKGLDKCTGCKRCGHEGHRKSKIQAHSGRNTCPHCPADEEGRCQAREFEQCECAFHRLDKQRKVVRALQRIKGSTDFLRNALAAYEEYQQQMIDAEDAVQDFCEQHGKADRMTWRHRPDLGQVYGVIHGCSISWEEATLRRKALPLLMEWDAARPHTQAEFEPTGIVKLHGGLEETCWRYLMTWKRTAVGPVWEQAQDREHLEAKGKSTDIRALRVSTVRETWPRLAQAFEAKRATDSAKKAGKAARAAAALDKATAGMAARLQAFLQPRTVSAPAKAMAGQFESRGLGSLSGIQQRHPVSAPATCSSDEEQILPSQPAGAGLATPQKTPCKRRPSGSTQAARESQQAKAEPHTPFASPTKRLKTPSASPAVRTLVHSPDTPQRPPVRSRAARPGGGLSQGRDDVDAALAAVSAVIQGSCADEEHAQSAAAISAGERAAGKKKPGKGAAAQRAAASAGPGQTAGLEQSAQGVSTPAKQPQARQGYAAGKASARDALGAARKAAAKRTAQAAAGSRPIATFFAKKPSARTGSPKSAAGRKTPKRPEVIDLSQSSPELQTPQAARESAAVGPTPSTGPDIVIELVTPPSSQQETHMVGS
ncbi:g3069 [Coccomyxa viridis]|uniref:G3069 protein n=1 Tax=Coccomyxa viridis TaxID=1274662 RepID=A0ABP1FS29_9CHLO